MADRAGPAVPTLEPAGAVEAYRASRTFTDKAVDSVCYAPFVSMEFDPAGIVYACCENQLYPLGRVAESTLRELWEGPRVRALREALVAGDLALGCNTCRWAIDHGNDQPIARGYDRLPVTSAQPELPGRMTFALSNRCNLECVMCNGELSSRIRTREGRPPLPPAYGEDFFAQLDEFLPALRVANFLGGEPFLINENFRIWEQMAARRLDTLCAVVTNGTRFDARVQRALDALRFEIVVSLDGVRAETVEAIRTNVDHATVLANAERFRDYARAAGTTFAFNYCLTPLNWSELGEFLAFADGWDAEVRVISVTEPGHSLHDLPEDELTAVLAHLEAEDRHRAPTLTRNAHAWSVELAQIRHTLAERRSGTGVTIRQPVAVRGPVVAPPATEPAAGSPDEALARARSQVRRWAHGGPVARLVTDPQGRIRRADLEGGSFLGVTAADAVDLDLDTFLGRTDGGRDRRLLVMDDWDEGGTVDRTILATTGEPVRGSVGTVFRVVATRTADGAEAFVAADRFYEHRPTG